MYLRDGVRCYLSETLRRERWITDGELNLQREGQSGEHCCFVTIDFKRSLVRFKDPDEAFQGCLQKQMGFSKRQDIPFSELLDVRLVKPNGFYHEVTETKFEVKTVKQTLLFEARNEQERNIWHRSFLMALSMQSKELFKQDFNSTLKVRPNEAGVFVPQLKTERSTEAGFKSANLQVTEKGISGQVKKAIEKVSFWNHEQPYHERGFALDFGQEHCYFYLYAANDPSPYRMHKQSDLVKCVVLDEELVELQYEERENKRSRSFLGRHLSSKTERCNWTFAWQLVFHGTNGRAYELYSPTRQERDQWVKVLGAIAEINQSGLNLQYVNPLNFIKERQKKRNQVEEQQDLSFSQVIRKEHLKVESSLKDDVDIWLALNETHLARQCPPSESYSSDTLRVTATEVRGNLKSAYWSHSQGYYLCPVSIYMNFRLQFIIIGESKHSIVSKVGFAELRLVKQAKPAPPLTESANFDPTCTHCFRLQFDE